jgi:hypothetical protein
VGPETQSSFGARLYALLLYLYPASFRREYGDSMLQLFNDQRRSARGAGAYAMLWWKTLRDLVLSVPAAHSNDASPKRSKGAAFVWTVVVVLGALFLVNELILPSMISRMTCTADDLKFSCTIPLGTSRGWAAAIVVPAPGVAPSGEYRAIAQVAAGAFSTLLAFGAFLLALRLRSLLTGAATFVAGAALTFMALAMNPWLWGPLDRYPAAITWALLVWPLAALAWLAVTIIARQQRAGGT